MLFGITGLGREEPVHLQGGLGRMFNLTRHLHEGVRSVGEFGILARPFDHYIGLPTCMGIINPEISADIFGGLIWERADWCGKWSDIR